MDMCDPRTSTGYAVCIPGMHRVQRHTQPAWAAERDSVILSGMAERTAVEHVDVLVIGAGLSGVGAGCHLSMSSPGKTFAILESREAIGGTWDLFRYPGIRSDSDMYTLGYSFRPWQGEKAIADGASILRYIEDTAAAEGIDRRIRFQHRIVRAEWSTADALWHVRAERTDTGA